MGYNLDDLKKVEASSVKSLRNPKEWIEAIIKVRKPDYVPDSVRIRSRIDELIFTGELRTEDLETLQNDPKVESISINKKLRSSK